MLRRIALPSPPRAELVRRARKQELSPDDIEIYPNKRVHNSTDSRGNSVSRAYNALGITQSQRFTLFKYAKAFVYQGYKTRAYDHKAMGELFGVSRDTINSWVERGHLGAPMVHVHQGGRKRYLWLYHQVQPMYIFYCHERNRGTTKTGLRFSAEGLKRLHVETERLEAAFRRAAGLPPKTRTIRDAYREAAGLYGVIWLSVDV
jgi:transposase